MSNNTKRSAFSEILQIMGDALAAAAAVRQSRQPAAHDLHGHGTDPERFRQTGRY
ncbi:MAG TPA: hypothetical protein GX405_15985 [Rhizobiales bacterium]|nr:hypothetical protein [Hyphomicrobiales bacterium]